MNEPILMQIGIYGFGSKGMMKRSTSGSVGQRSKSQEAEVRFGAGEHIILDPLG